jgi:hypothetical protein
MRHLRGLASIEVALMASRVVRTPLVRLLVSPAGSNAGLAPRADSARPRAVAVAAVALTAQEEYLATPTTRHEAKRLHGSGCDRQKFGGSPSP